jgi:hypothetical protein
MVPLALAGVEGAHATANALVGASASEVFESAASGRGSIGFVVGAFAAVVAAALAGRVLGLWSDSPTSPTIAAPFAVLPPLAFFGLEFAEAASGGDASSWHWLVEPSFAVGLVLQLPVAAGAYSLARVLLRISDRIRRFVRRHPPPRLRHLLLPAVVPLRDDACRDLTTPRPRRGRAPPLPSPIPG